MLTVKHCESIEKKRKRSLKGASTPLNKFISGNNIQRKHATED